MRFVLDPEMTPELFEQLLLCWTEVTNADGAVGFVPPVTPDVIRPTAEKAFARTRSAGGPGAPDSLLAGFGDDGEVAAWLILADNDSRLRAHWRWVLRVMVHPKHQGKGYGRALLSAADDAARSLGLEALQLTCRGGTGVDAFYASAGYREVGRVPRSIRLAPGDERDEIYMLRWL
ncbi:GNAT family N-acetyltransferase [Microbispora triticiradicis]|uniref:GNAT family N-acetyltransferase n=3 Tax=Microbispora TaxID=2005 RepID=A0ABY3M0K7_9ACTN|nr:MULTISPECIES: GNAT family N-acetyltransferase [Microbispora]RGA06434.1 GNAT family N-acetyltransferase [Microbispora triticiradicis]TLP62435.1 GNAT family N-acetyltransferase [Microbispora fusca]TYB62466.1 GNAT family N-acetyltransferase [Microbispora tritici]GLW22218.1 N-acetyltransferase [Microbispora amethystogenes]